MKLTLSKFFAIAALSLPLTALAHSGHAGHASHSLLDGLTHPFSGIDHLIAMLLVGVWSVLHARKVWLAPLCFVTLLSIGVMLGQHSLIVPQLELLIAASVLALGVMLIRPAKLAMPAALALIGGFALFHGMAHGGELVAGSSVLAGIVLGSALLHGTGMAFAHLALRNRPQLAQRFGQVIAVVGGGLILSTVSTIL